MKTLNQTAYNIKLKKARIERLSNILKKERMQLKELMSHKKNLKK